MTDRILFLSSNGTGLGHLTRSMAIARRLDESLEPLFFTLSGAAPVVAEQGFPVEFAASYATPTAGSDWRWSRRLRGRLRAVMRDADPRVLVFDGAHPYQALLDAMPSVPDAHRVWCRRPMWKPGSNFGALERTRFFDQVLEPGEFAASEDRGATVALRDDAFCVDPVVFCDDTELYERADAERKLGLEPGGVNVLVQLGQGERGTGGVRALLGAPRRPRWSARGGAPLAPDRDGRHTSGGRRARLHVSDEQVPARVRRDGLGRRLQRLPRADPLRRALAVRADAPADRRPGGARPVRGGKAAWAWAWTGPPRRSSKPSWTTCSTPRDDEAMQDALIEQRPPNGAAPAAEWLAGLAATERRRKPGTKRWKRYAAHPVTSARAAAPFAARVPGALGRIAHQTVTRPKARVLVDAGDLSPEQVASLLPQAIEESGEAPERVLVLTGRVDVLPVLRKAGVGGEHVRAPGRRDLILAERPRIKRTVTL